MTAWALGPGVQVTSVGPRIQVTTVSNVAQCQPSSRFALSGASSHQLGLTGLWEIGATPNPELLLHPTGAVRGGSWARPAVSSCGSSAVCALPTMATTACSVCASGLRGATPPTWRAQRSQ